MQLFVSTGNASKHDLNEIDDQVIGTFVEYGRRILQMIDQLLAHAPKNELIGSKISSEWSNWLSGLNSKKMSGYSDVKFENEDGVIIMLESAIDIDSELFGMLASFKSSLAATVGKASYELPNFDEIYLNEREIIEEYWDRQRVLSRISR